MPEVKLLFIVFTSSSSAEVTVRKGNKVRRVNYRWQAVPNIMPSNWWDDVVLELNVYEADELAKAQGRYVP